MPDSPRARRRLHLFIVAAVLLALFAVLAERSCSRHTRLRINPVAAYLVPVDERSLARFPWQRSFPLSRPVPLHTGETVTIPSGSQILLIHAATGASEPVTGPSRLVLNPKPPDSPHALVSPLPDVITALQELLASTRNATGITSPIGVTRFLNPTITWAGREGVYYDVAVADQADAYAPVRLTTHVTSPTPLSELRTTQPRRLAADRNYEIALRISNSELVVASARFLTLPEATADASLPDTPQGLIAEAAAAMALRPTRTGDAWLALEKLPPDWARSELAIRLRLLVAAELGRGEAFDKALADAALLRSRSPRD